MSVRNRIQVRRGYSMGYSGEPIPSGNTGYSFDPATTTWLANSILYEGEIGYEVDTGKFKIGRKDVDTGDLISWENLDYGGGGGGIGGLIAGSGIGIVDLIGEDDSLFSIIASGDNNLTIELKDISSLIDGAVGSYYELGLADDLTDINSINVSGNIVASGVDVRNITTSIVATENIGAIPAGQSFDTNDAITDILKQILEKVFEPTVNPEPSLNMTLSFPGGISNLGNVEAGTTGDVTINASFNQGLVKGTGLGASWNPTANQGVRAGSATQYTINSQNMGLTPSLTINNVTVADGTTTYNSNSVAHATGIVPQNSLGQNSTTLTQLAAGTINGNNVSINGRRKVFYGTSTSVIDPPTTSSEIRNLSGSELNPTLNTTFNIVAATGIRTMIVAVPSGAGYSSVANGNFAVLDTNTNLFITPSFESTSINVEGASGYDAVTYKVYYYVNNAPTTEVSTYNVRLNNVT
jgi:hypothetical protein